MKGIGISASAVKYAAATCSITPGQDSSCCPKGPDRVTGAQCGAEEILNALNPQSPECNAQRLRLECCRINTLRRACDDLVIWRSVHSKGGPAPL